MTGEFTGGFFFNSAASAVEKRLLSGQVDPRLDDVFALALGETKVAREKIDKRERRLLAQLDRIEEEIRRLGAERVEIEARLSKQHEILSRYQEGEALTNEERDLVTPALSAEKTAEDKVARDEALAAVEDTLPEGWEKVGHRVADGFIYVTIKRAVVNTAQAVEPLAQRVRKALAVFFAPDFDRQGRVQVWNRRASLAPIVPGAG